MNPKEVRTAKVQSFMGAAQARGYGGPVHYANPVRRRHPLPGHLSYAVAG